MLNTCYFSLSELGMYVSPQDVFMFLQTILAIREPCESAFGKQHCDDIVSQYMQMLLP